jgi:hypothetical protein
LTTISGFSDTGNTTVAIDNWTKGAGSVRVAQTAKATTMKLANHHYLRFVGDTFSAVQQGTVLVTTCHKTAGTATEASLANFVQAMAGFAAPAPIAASPSLAPAESSPLVLAAPTADASVGLG